MKKFGFVYFVLLALLTFGKSETFADEERTPLIAPYTKVGTGTYTTIEAFESAEGAICKSATDGCNTYFMMEDGTVGGGTLMYCPEAPVWSCTQLRDDIKFKGEILTVSETEGLSENDANLYMTIQARLAEKYSQKVDTVMEKVTLLEGKISGERMKKILGLLETKLEEKISTLHLKYPQDSALPESVNNVYMMLTYLKLKIQLFGASL